MRSTVFIPCLTVSNVTAATLRTKHQLRLLLQKAGVDVDAGEEKIAGVVEVGAMLQDAAALRHVLL